MNPLTFFALLAVQDRSKQQSTHHMSNFAPQKMGALFATNIKDATDE